MNFNETKITQGTKPCLFFAMRSTPSPPAELESVLAEYCELVTINPSFLRSQLLRKATLQWHGRTLRGRTRITNFLRLKQRFGALRNFVFEQPVECPPFDCAQNRFGSMSHGDGQEPPGGSSGSRRASRARKRSATLTPTKPASPASEVDVDVDILSTNDDEIDILQLTPLLPPLLPALGGQDPLSGMGLLPLDSGDPFAGLGYRTPPRGSDASLPPNPSVYDALRLRGMGRSTIDDSNSSGTSSASSVTSTDDDEPTGARPEARPIEAPEQASSVSEKKPSPGGGDAVERFGKLRFLRAKSCIQLAPPAAGTSPPPERQYRRASVAGSSCDLGTPSHLALAYRMNRTTRRPHFQQIVYHWPSAKAGARRKLFDTVEPPPLDGLPGDGGQHPTGATPKYEPEKLVPMAAQAFTASALAPRPTRRASEIVIGLRPLPTSPPPSPRAVRYPYPPSTPVKRRRSVAMHLRTPPPLIGSTASSSSSGTTHFSSSSSSSSSSSTSSSSSSSSTSSSSFIAIPFEYGRVCRKQLRADTPPPSASAAMQPPPSGSATPIPFHAGGAGAGPLPGHLIRLGNTPVPAPEQGADGRRKSSPTAAAAPAVPARKPPRL
ncbi:hypothetical protein ZHAS_00000582 [Anopheles sinensis]|uniref:Uncharacterized protein n=1 Tax=Anopheles sinensis TaxID=74873 RepID=A0A084VAA5_ANOSI|nr:hypothetical protein ZHAS_00000582 [Anopheles sinensis]